MSATVTAPGNGTAAANAAAPGNGTAAANGTARKRGRPGYDRDTLLAAATGVFTGRGYDGTTMAELAAALGITKSTIYHHVSGKEELLSRALDVALGALETAVAESLASPGSAAARLEQLLRASVQTLVAEMPSVTLLLRVRGNTDVERAALVRRRKVDAEFAALVARAQADGDLRSDLDPFWVARLVFGTVNSLIEWYHPRGAADDIADAVCALVFDGLRRA